MKRIYNVGGGSISWVRAHLALSAPAYGTTAKLITSFYSQREEQKLEMHQILTRMADPSSRIETTEDLARLAERIKQNIETKIVIWSPSVVDYTGSIDGILGSKDAPKFETREGVTIELTPGEKIASTFRDTRKDIFLAAFKHSHGLDAEEQYNRALRMLKRTSANLVLANDTSTRLNMIITPEEAPYHISTDRKYVLENLLDMCLLRSHLTYTRSTVVSGEPISWNAPQIPEILRNIVDYCIEQGAYRKVNGVTAGHFACKLEDNLFITSRRKTDFNNMKEVGLVLIKTDGPDDVIAYGSKPSVGGQSQRIVFETYKDLDCIVHFHCPILPTSQVPTVSQREFECGSHECGRNTAKGLKQFGRIHAVYLDNHGPNIVFNSKNITLEELINFINENFDLNQKTGGFQVEKYEEEKV